VKIKKINLFIELNFFLLEMSSNATIQILSNELWCEIFSYFDCEELVYSFNYLNLFIQTLLCNYSLRIHLNIPLKTLSFSIFPSAIRPTQIISLCVYYHSFDTFDTMYRSHFNRIHSLHLVFINNEELERISRLQLPDLY
jgi:hypothetical protein